MQWKLTVASKNLGFINLILITKNGLIVIATNGKLKIEDTKYIPITNV